MKAIHELIESRRSTVLFSDKTIDKDSIESLFEAARWAPSSRNQQPWRFIYVLKNDPDFVDWLECLNEKNREWAQNASMLILTVAQVISDYKKRENTYALHDTAMAYSNLVFQAVYLGISVHPMGGFEKEKIKNLVLIPTGYEPLVVAAVGYKSKSSNFSENLLERENSLRKRKSINEIVFRQQFPRK